jgi:DNA-directed RNA polymerase specialized sigma24 family protein
VPEENGPSATQLEKLAALNALKPEDHGKLLRYAGWIASKSSGRVNDSDGEDLYQEAIVRVLDERNIRKWYPQKVDFFTFMRGCIRSIASEFYKGAKETESPDNLLDPTRHDAQTEAAIMIEKIRETLKDRPHAVEIFDLKRYGHTAKEIQERLGIREQVYAAAVKWIERTLKQEGFWQ